MFCGPIENFGAKLSILRDTKGLNFYSKQKLQILSEFQVSVHWLKSGSFEATFPAFSIHIFGSLCELTLNSIHHTQVIQNNNHL
jgi:hypothetical protein